MYGPQPTKTKTRLWATTKSPLYININIYYSKNRDISYLWDGYYLIMLFNFYD